MDRSWREFESGRCIANNRAFRFIRIFLDKNELGEMLGACLFNAAKAHIF